MAANWWAQKGWSWLQEGEPTRDRGTGSQDDWSGRAWGTHWWSEPRGWASGGGDEAWAPEAEASAAASPSGDANRPGWRPKASGGKGKPAREALPLAKGGRPTEYRSKGSRATEEWEPGQWRNWVDGELLRCLWPLPLKESFRYGDGNDDWRDLNILADESGMSIALRSRTRGSKKRRTLRTVHVMWIAGPPSTTQSFYEHVLETAMLRVQQSVNFVPPHKCWMHRCHLEGVEPGLVSADEGWQDPEETEAEQQRSAPLPDQDVPEVEEGDASEALPLATEVESEEAAGSDPDVPSDAPSGDDMNRRATRMRASAARRGADTSPERQLDEADDEVIMISSSVPDSVAAHAPAERRLAGAGPTPPKLRDEEKPVEASMPQSRWERPDLNIGEPIGADIATYEPDKPDDPFLARMFLVTEQRLAVRPSGLEMDAEKTSSEALPLGCCVAHYHCNPKCYPTGKHRIGHALLTRT